MARRRTILTAALAGVVTALLPACDPPPPVPTLVVTSTTDALDDAPGDGSCTAAAAGGGCTLRAALAEAAAAGGADITVPAGSYALSVADPLDGDPDLDVTGRVRFNPGAAAAVQVQTAGERTLDVQAGGQLWASGITLFDSARVAGSLVLGESWLEDLDGVGGGGVPVAALQIAPGGTVALSNTAVAGLSTVATVDNQGTFNAAYSSLVSVVQPFTTMSDAALATGPGGSSTIAATTLSSAITRGSVNPSADLCDGGQPTSAGYNHAPNDSCALGQATDVQTGGSHVDLIPAGTLGCGAGIDRDLVGTVRPQDAQGDGVAACDVGAFEQIAPG